MNDDMIPVGGVKDDSDKLRYDLIPPESLRLLATVLTYGAAKYSADNWMQVPDGNQRYYAAMQRHMEQWRLGEVFDDESGLPHLAHAATCVMFLLALEQGVDQPWYTL